jgi:hypothetical protein
MDALHRAVGADDKVVDCATLVVLYAEIVPSA